MRNMSKGKDPTSYQLIGSYRQKNKQKRRFLTTRREKARYTVETLTL